MASAAAPDDQEAFPAPRAADSFACVLEHLGEQCIDLDESPDTKTRAASASASSTVLDSSASPNKKQRHALATIPVTQQSPDRLLDPAMVAGPVQDPATMALPSCGTGDAAGHDSRRQREGGPHADHDISSGALPITITSESDDESPFLVHQECLRLEAAAQAQQRAKPSYVDTFFALHEHGLPADIESWKAMQTVYFGGHPRLPHGWIRCWSKTRLVAFYHRLSDGFSTFEWSDMKAVSSFEKGLL
jgi:hypothetical protein